MVSDMKIWFAAAECAPFIKTGGLGDVAAAFPKALAQNGVEACVVLPLYKSIKQNFIEQFTFVTSFTVPLSWRGVYCGVFRYEADGVRYYFLDNEYYFLRDSVYGDYDDGERYAFYCKAVLEMMQYLGDYPDVIHCNDWQAAMIPLFLKGFYQHLSGYSGIRTMFTIHNIEYQGKVSYSFLREVLGMDEAYMQYLDYGGCVNLMFSAICLADKVTTVSPTYAEEVKTAFYGRGLQEVLSGVSYKFCGILNGLDTSVCDPHTDPHLFHKYSTKAMAGKKIGKRRLQEMLGLHADTEIPIVAMITRLVGHKGLDLVQYVLHEMMERRLQLVVLGTGEKAYEQMFWDAAGAYPGRVSANIRFDADLASKLYAGADMFLMPSLSEPCGLAQMIAMRYGTVPIVRETGGLKDTVWPINPETGEGRGFTFQSYNAHDMLGAVDRSLSLYYDNRELWKKIVRSDMEQDFSWARSAQQYIRIYESM